MPRMARGEYLNPDEVQVVHGVQRCVRQAFLCGRDRATGRSYEHRRGWIRQRLEFLASVFGIDCLTYTVLSNHLHVVLRSRPDVVGQWSDQEVARRWLRLFPPPRRGPLGRAAESDSRALDGLAGNKARLALIRRRLSDVSWWMRCLAEHIARRANAEDGVGGRFWQGRFRAQLLLDEASLLACSVYVDLNPIRAAMARTPEESAYTGAKERLDDLRERSPRGLRPKGRTTHDWERSRRREHSGWMSPVEIDERVDPPGADASDCGRRASRKGYLSMPLTRYLELLDWTGRSIRSDKRGSIPSELAPLLSRIGLDGPSWCELVERFGRIFKRVAAGTADAVAQEATRRGQSYLQAPGLALFRPAAA